MELFPRYVFAKINYKGTQDKLLSSQLARQRAYEQGKNTLNKYPVRNTIADIRTGSGGQQKWRTIITRIRGRAGSNNYYFVNDPVDTRMHEAFKFLSNHPAH